MDWGRLQGMKELRDIDPVFHAIATVARVLIVGVFVFIACRAWIDEQMWGVLASSLGLFLFATSERSYDKLFVMFWQALQR